MPFIPKNQNTPRAISCTIGLQKKDGNLIAYWNKDTRDGAHVVSKVILLDDLKKLNLDVDAILSLFPEKGAYPRPMRRLENSQLLDGIASLCNFIPLDKGGIFPGADDDGSEVVTLLETAKILLASNIQFKKPIYLIWYAAEEEGQLGSAEVVKDFKNKNIPVEAVMQLDQTGYFSNNDRTIYLDVDKTDPTLTTYLQTLAIYYLKQSVKPLYEGGQSDHVSWFNGGFKNIVAPGESYSRLTLTPTPNPNPYAHSPEDTIDKLSLDRMTDYLKLTIAFITELAEPVS